MRKLAPPSKQPSNDGIGLPSSSPQAGGAVKSPFPQSTNSA